MPPLKCHHNVVHVTLNAKQWNSCKAGLASILVIIWGDLDHTIIVIIHGFPVWASNFGLPINKGMQTYYPSVSPRCLHSQHVNHILNTWSCAQDEVTDDGTFKVASLGHRQGSLSHVKLTSRRIDSICLRFKQSGPDGVWANGLLIIGLVTWEYKLFNN